MKLQISQLNEGETPLRYDSSKDAWLKALMTSIEKQKREIRFEKPMVVDLRLTKLEPDYYLKGRIDFEANEPCGRCAEASSLPMKHSFEIGLSHVQSGKKREAKAEEDSEEVDLIFFEGNELDLGPILEEQIFLSLPLQALCNPDCKGICQHCGKNLNSATCGCQKDFNLSPFAVLKDLKP